MLIRQEYSEAALLRAVVPEEDAHSLASTQQAQGTSVRSVPVKACTFHHSLGALLRGSRSSLMWHAAICTSEHQQLELLYRQHQVAHVAGLAICQVTAVGCVKHQWVVQAGHSTGS